MDEEESGENRYRLFSENGMRLVVQHDHVFVTLFTGILAGLTALLLSQRETGYWAGVLFLLAAVSAVVGVGMCLLHMLFSSKVMLLLAALFAGEESVPNLVPHEEPTAHAVAKNKAFAQVTFAGELLCLTYCVFFAALGLAALLWSVVGWTGAAIAGLFTLLLLISMLYPLIKVFAAARRILESRPGN